MTTASKVTHTPGPWIAKKRRTIYGHAHFISMHIGKLAPNATGEAVFDVQPYARPAIAEANARLIAAAPAMLAALERLTRQAECTCHDGGENFTCDVCEARAALAAAKGE